MKVLVVGSGGREHALAWKLSSSSLVTGLYAANGNAGIASVAKCVDISPENVTEVAKFAVKEKMDLVVVGPEVPLCLGIVDLLEHAGIKTFGPSAGAARLEGSKIFSKRLMRKYDIPTADFGDFTDFKEAVLFAKTFESGMWIKASGLAAGKGAIFAEDTKEAVTILKSLMQEAVFGEAGKSVVIEENLTGEETSVFAICDGETYKIFVPSQDHKRAFDGDNGPNTGGMGAYAPAPLVTPEILESIENKIIRPTIDGMASEGVPYKGLLYAGVMVSGDEVKTLEYNCRFGDPETQCVMPLIEGDLAEIMIACSDGKLDSVHVGSNPGFAMCVVMASGGYPGDYKKGSIIKGIEEADSLEGVKVFHAGTRFDGKDIITSGGRVLGVTGWGKDFNQSRERAYNAVSKISFDGAFFRKDIGEKAKKYLHIK